MSLASDLDSIARLPGVMQAVMSDDAGRLLGCAGGGTPPTAALLVLAQATLTAAAELGRRSGYGDCLELVQRHQDGWMFLQARSHGHVLMVRCQDEAAIATVRAACQHVAAGAQQSAESVVELPRPVTNSPLIHDLASAFLAEPAW